MREGGTGQRERVSRRALLASGAAGFALSASGCAESVHRVVDGGNHLPVTITAVPADDDRQVNGIFRALVRHLEAAGVAVSIDLRSAHDFERTVLLENDFDIYVGRHPGLRDPDSLYELLHSRYANEAGWQNPFGFTSIDLDERLDAQRRETGEPRRRTLASIFETLVEEKPFVPLCIPDENRVVRTDRYVGWDRHHLAERMGYLDLERVGDVDALTGLVTDGRPTQNLNPLAVHYRNRGTITELLYDSLGTWREDELAPWLAADWKWNDGVLSVRLRSDLRFHDGEPLDADDVAFTFEFLRDLSLGRAESPIPAPRFRRETTAVERVAAVDRDTVRFVADASRAVASDALTVPILPEHVWRPLVEDLDRETATTEEWLWDEVFDEDVEPVGSGPYAVVDRVERERIELERFDEHVSLRPGVALPGPPAESFEVLVSPNGASAVEAVDEGRADVTVSALHPHVMDAAREAEEARVVASDARTCYHVGFNVRRSPFGNPRFRRAVTALLDRDWIVEDMFDGLADPVAVPFADDRVPSAFAWDGADPAAPFAGSDGELDESAARERFRDAGFRYDEDGRLVVNR